MSPGCAHCYAETWALRYDTAVWGEQGSRRRTSAANWAKPLAWERAADRWFAERGHRRRVFCASLADVFEPRDELAEWREDLLRGTILATPNLDWLILTKRPDVARDWIDANYGPRFPEVFPNVWLGTSIENARFTWRADVLRECRVALRFLSCEPLLGSLFPPASDTRRPPSNGAPGGPGLTEPDRGASAGAGGKKPLDLTGIDWVIVGGESGGKQARPMRQEWAREIRDAVIGHKVLNAGRLPMLHLKQWGSHDADGVYRGPAPTAGGKLLDGKDWCEVPASSAGEPAPARLFA